MAIKQLVLIIGVLLLSGNCEFSQKLNVAVFYESLCPDSIKFINEQLRPSWPDVGPYLNLQLIPFGKSSSINGGKSFECQHGPKECMGNKIQSCALSGISDINTQIHFVHCFMNTFSRVDAGQSCAAQVGLNWDYVEQCYHSEIGMALQLQAEVATKNIAPKFVPTIVYNGVFNQEDQDISQRSFKSVVCKYLRGADVCEREYAIQI